VIIELVDDWPLGILVLEGQSGFRGPRKLTLGLKVGSFFLMNSGLFCQLACSSTDAKLLFTMGKGLRSLEGVSKLTLAKG